MVVTDLFGFTFVLMHAVTMHNLSLFVMCKLNTLQAFRIAKNGSLRRVTNTHLINLFLQQFDFIVEFIDVVKKCKVLILHFNKFGNQEINILDTSGLLDCLECCFI